ncbi:hypothetical protein [Lysobacter gummosus]|uniref:hypothetical protein n=1 Tax=Lysobacter gummosus TaxID=262324 RepID=UPI0036342DF8
MPRRSFATIQSARPWIPMGSAIRRLCRKRHSKSLTMRRMNTIMVDSLCPEPPLDGVSPDADRTIIATGRRLHGHRKERRRFTQTHHRRSRRHHRRTSGPARGQDRGQGRGEENRA